MGLLGSFNPARLRCIALVTLSTASSCPIISSLRRCPMLSSLFVSLWAILFTGMFVDILSTMAISSSVTVVGVFASLSSQFFLYFSISAVLSFSRSLYMAAFSKLRVSTASFLFALRTSSSFSNCVSFFGIFRFLRCARLPASSITSMALSGRFLSVIYLSLNLMAAFSASSVYIALWCLSYLPFILSKIESVSLKLVGSTIIFWKRLSKAPSFSINCHPSQVPASTYLRHLKSRQNLLRQSGCASHL